VLTPRYHQPYHRTVSIDYAVITSGSITLILDENKRITLNAGDVLVQRGTIHGWHNEGTEWCRMFCVMLRESKSYCIKGITY
jgi:quercetin dioxygenase-like cupin family protein